MVALPFCNVHTTVKKPPHEATYPKELRTIGDHIRKVRFDRGLWQCHVAEQMGVCEGSIMKWENNLCRPQIKFWPQIIGFLDYDPEYEAGKSLPITLRNYRRKYGLSQKNLAFLVGVDPTSILRWERGRELKYKRSVRQLEEFFEKEGIEGVKIPYLDSVSQGKANYAKWLNNK